MRLRVRSVVGREDYVVALVNSGYETRRPELLVPLALAERLGLYPRLPVGSEVREYVLADGSRARLIRVPQALHVAVVAEDRVGPEAVADAVIAERAEEPLISDKLADALGVSVIAPGEGLWCFRDELGRRLRRSL